MSQFAVFRNPRGGAFPYVLDVQADLLDDLATRIVAPLMSARKFGKPIGRLNPIVTIDGAEYVVVFQELAAVPAKTLLDPVQSLSARRNDLIAALDLLFSGI